MNDDVISRQAAIELIDRMKSYHQDADDIAEMIANMPPAQPERKTGRWVGHDGDWLKTMCKCSKCGAMIDINEKNRNFFCYHCGARMYGEEDEKIS